MKEFEKIETVFNRDLTGSKKLIEGNFRSKTIEYLKDSEWVFTEKIDGTNIRVEWNGHKVSFAGRTDDAQIPAHLLAKLEDLFGGMVNEEVFEQKFGSKNVILFGEGYGYKIQNGGNYRQDVSFILFDVFIDGLYLERDNVQDIANAFSIEIVPIVMTGTIQKAIDFVKSKPKSTIGVANMEGVVGKPKFDLFDRCGNRLIVKIKVKDFC